MLSFTIVFLIWFTGAIIAEVGATESQASHQRILDAYEKKLQLVTNDIERERIMRARTLFIESRS